MKCVKCGCVFDEGLFCPECGTKYDADAAQKYEENLKKQREMEEQEAQKRKEEEARKLEIKCQEEREKRELEKEKAKAEQERLAKERAEKEIELLKQQNEKMRMEQEKAAQNAERERIQEEKLSRTFNGVLYDSIEEMNIAKTLFEEEERRKKDEKKQNTKALWSMILGIAAYPLTMTVFFWFPAIIASLILGIGALRGKTARKAWAIIGLVLDMFFVLIIVLLLIILSQSPDSTSSEYTSSETINENEPEKDIQEMASEVETSSDDISSVMLNEDMFAEGEQKTTTEIAEPASEPVRTIIDTINEALEANEANKYNPEINEDYSLNFSFWNPEYRIFSTQIGDRELTAVIHWDSPSCTSGEISFGYDYGEEYCYECFINDDWLCEFHVEDEAYNFYFVTPTSITYLRIDDMDGNTLIEIPAI